MRQRTPHRKSRFGCKECKQRHVKCDESRPSCVNCSTALRRCSYLDTETTLPSPSAFMYQCPSPAASTESSAAAAGSIPIEQPMYRPQYPPTEPYDLLHMELLFHFEHELGAEMEFGDSTREKFQRMSIKQALGTPYLMDELLALSAAHMSTLPGKDQAFYRAEATRLQTRALSQFNLAKAEVSNENFLAIFLYSTWLGQHVLFDTFIHQGNFATVLDKLVHCMNLHRGIRTIVAGSWSILRGHLVAHLGPDSPFVDSIIIEPDAMERGTECAGLVELFDKSDLGESTRSACREAIDALQLMFDVQNKPGISPGRRRATVQEWSIRVPTEYVNLLDQRRPEALVVLAYWAVLLHLSREYWAYANAGKALVQSISAHLGTYWSEWLAWPQKMVDGPSACTPVDPSLQ
ncbi:Sterol uptake control protein 2 [Colletotrichum siamense]|uniref:Sterol uptake control protein 2 n=1 Tax=Colletotrichum siamense TaxID=690259 RepID=UPI001872CFEE|nr:Sterol uptake control protein 2 [Colletotrichum siamense]KAF5489502.1 Sterol uptake control protein 2 [Colletotrichum siamense]